MTEDEHITTLTPSGESLRRLLPLAQKSKCYLFLALALLATMAVIQVILPQVMRLAIDGPLATQVLGAPQRWNETKELGLLFLSFLILAFLSNYLSSWYLQKFGQNLVLNLRYQVFSKIHRLPISYFDQHAIGRTVTRVVNDSNALSEFFISVLATGLKDLILLIGILLVLLFSDPALCAIVGIFCPFLLAFVFWFRRNSAPLYRTQRRLLAEINGYFSETLEGLDTVKSFQGENFQKERFSLLNQAYLQNELKLLRLVATFRPGFSVARTTATGLLLVVGGFSIIDETSSLGTLVSSMIYVRLLFTPLEQLAERYNILIKASVASERVLELLDLEEESNGYLKHQIFNDTELRAQKIVFENVSFHYQKEKPVLRNVSFSLNPGESVALVGPTGSGKSTLISLLLGFYKLNPSEGHTGRILIGENEFSKISLTQWRRNLALVSQDLFLFKSTIAQNVGLFDELEPEQLSRALTRSLCQDFIDELPEGAETIVGEKGHSLSTGQRQLLSFARAIAFDPHLLILDEATANIDSESEKKVEEALDILLTGRQAIIVAHRLSTVRRANRILVLADGEIKEQGSHSELLRLDGLYAELHREASSS